MQSTTALKKHLINRTSGSQTLLRSESGSLCSNRLATGQVTYVLPDNAELGEYFEFLVSTAQVLLVDTVNSEIWAGGSQGSSTGGISADDEGEMLIIHCVGNGVWVASKVEGTWTAV